METTYIYTITDPRINKVFYVGKTINPRSRFGSHMNSKNSNPGIVIQEIIKSDLKPKFSIIEECQKNHYDREAFWVNHYHSLGCPLVNYVSNKKHRQLPYDIEITEGIEFNESELTELGRP